MISTTAECSESEVYVGAEHRFAGGDKGMHQRNLVFVACAVPVPGVFQRCLAITAGPDVGAAMQHQAVDVALEDGVAAAAKDQCRLLEAALGDQVAQVGGGIQTQESRRPRRQAEAVESI